MLCFGLPTKYTMGNDIPIRFSWSLLYTPALGKSSKRGSICQYVHNPQSPLLLRAPPHGVRFHLPSYGRRVVETTVLMLKNDPSGQEREREKKLKLEWGTPFLIPLLTLRNSFTSVPFRCSICKLMINMEMVAFKTAAVVKM